MDVVDFDKRLVLAAPDGDNEGLFYDGDGRLEG
jgi:hypothetical protein